MVWLTALGYLTGISLIIYLLFRILVFLTDGDHTPVFLLQLVAVFMVSDLLSTLYFVRFLGLGWAAEGNAMVRNYGNSIGHLNALIINLLLQFSGLYLLGIILKKWKLCLTFIYGIFILNLAFAILTNIIISSLIKIFGGHL